MPVPTPPAIANAVVTVANDMVNSALRLLGAVAAGESPEISESNDALNALIAMVDSWNADRLAIFTTGSQDFPFVNGKQSYTLGSGGDFDTTRPPFIDSMSAILLNNPDNPVELPIAMYAVDQWQTQVPVKNVTSSFPQICYDDGGFPLRTLNFWPIASEGNSVRIYSWQPLLLPTSLQTKIILPPGYAEGFRFNLALRLAPEYQLPVPAVVQQVATESLARLKTINTPEMTLRSDLVASPAGYNYKADLFGIGL